MHRAEPLPSAAPAAHAASRATIVASLLLLLVTLAGAGLPEGWASLLGLPLLLFILALEFPRIGRTHKSVGLVLLVIGLAAALAAERPLQTILDGIGRAQHFVLLFAAVAMLGYPAQASPTIAAAHRAFESQRSRQRFLSVMLFTHLVGATLNLIALALFAGPLRREQEKQRRHLLRALLGGFLAASCWSPYFLSMTVVHFIYPDIAWSRVLPMGVIVAATLIGAQWLAHLAAAPARPAAPSESGLWTLATLVRLGGIIASLTLLVILLIEGLGLSAPIAIGLVAPTGGLAWTLLIRRTAPDSGANLGGYARHSLSALPGLRNETLLFTGANVMATGIAAALPPNLAAAWLAALGWGEAGALGLVVLGMCLMGAVGLHPVVILVVTAQLVSPAGVGLSPELMAVLLLAMWGISTALSPLSAVTLYASRLSGVSPWRLAWRWNAPMALLNALLLLLLLSAMRALE